MGDLVGSVCISVHLRVTCLRLQFHQLMNLRLCCFAITSINLPNTLELAKQLLQTTTPELRLPVVSQFFLHINYKVAIIHDGGFRLTEWVRD
jgi:hypothetical protein